MVPSSLGTELSGREKRSEEAKRASWRAEGGSAEKCEFQGGLGNFLFAFFLLIIMSEVLAKYWIFTCSR